MRYIENRSHNTENPAFSGRHFCQILRGAIVLFTAVSLATVDFDSICPGHDNEVDEACHHRRLVLCRLYRVIHLFCHQIK